MKKLIAVLALAAVSAPLAAHTTGIPYQSRGECEAAYAGYSKLDRERLSAMGFTPGAAQRTFRDLFACQYDSETDSWFIVFIGGGS